MPTPMFKHEDTISTKETGGGKVGPDVASTKAQLEVSPGDVPGAINGRELWPE